VTIASIAADYAASTQALIDVVESLTEAQLDVRHGEGWSARQVVHHVADSEAQSYARLRRLLAEPAGSIIQGYDEAAWAESALLGYEELPIAASFDVFKAVRASSLILIHRMTESDLARYGEHSEAGHYSVERWLATYTRHPLEHADQIREAIS